jgi:putative peptidoglycan lipid II flippase
MSADGEGRPGATRDSLVVGGGTAVSRLTGVLRVIMVGAVLGPTQFGNTFQLTNSLPNLIYYGFLAGSLFSSLLVPALVHHVDAGMPGHAARVSGGFLGTAWLALAVLVPIAVLVVPQVVGLLAPGQSVPAADQAQQTRVLLLLTCPQVFLYAVVGSAGAVMNAHRRFALPAIAPAVENLGVIAVLGTVWLLFGRPSDTPGSQPVGEVLLLGLGSTAAVAVHAALQWWGARTQGVVLRPRPGWRDPEVAAVVRRALRSVAQAGLLALQMLVLLLLAGRVAGGTVALQMVFNFYYLPIALVATPVGLALLPRLSRMHRSGRVEELTTTFLEGVELALFFAVPAAVGYVLLAGPVAHGITVGAMNSAAGVAMVSGTLAAMAVGLIGQTVFFIATQAAYARDDTRTPLVSMAVQAAVCLALSVLTVLVPGPRAVVLLGLAYGTGALLGGLHLLWRVTRAIGLPIRRLGPLVRRLTIGAVVMAVPVRWVAHDLVSRIDGRAGWVLALGAGTLAGVAVFLVAQLLMRSPELGALRRAVRREAGPLAVSEEQVP